VPLEKKGLLAGNPICHQKVPQPLDASV